MHEQWHKLIPPAAGFFGATIMMTFLGRMETRKWVIALSSGPIIAYLGTEAVVSYLVSTFAWLPTGESSLLKLSGLVGAVLGLMAIHIVGAAATYGKRLSNDPTDLGNLK